MSAAGEQVWVVPRATLFPRGAPHGFWRPGAGEMELLAARGRFAERAAVEDNPSLKQVIPYAIVRRGDAILVCRRARKGGDRRLQGLRSIGVGGHINPCDAPDPVAGALRREIEEELVIPRGWRWRIAGWLNDDTTAVGAVHLGVVAVVEPGEGVVEVREADRMSGSFLARADLLELHARERASFESWTSLLLDRLDEVIGWARPRVSSTTIPKATPTSTT
ncbi:MAG: hypothetical protein ACT4PV_00550 [Planctomycetaceae bacterium]